jgi:hypothetical protein
MLVSSSKHATNSRASGSPPGDVEVEAADAPPSILAELNSAPQNDVETRVADAAVSAVSITDEETPSDSVVGTEPGTTPNPLSTRGPPDYDSITAALLAGCGHPRIFVSLARQLEIYNEDIETSLVQYHPVMDPARR